jgi:hypothetical protein
MIIHSPIISGSLTFAEGATFTLPDNGEYSGSFSGSIQIDEVQSSLIPNTSGTLDLGSETNPWGELWLIGETIRLGGIKIGGIGGKLNINKNDDTPADIGAKSITIGGIGVTGSKTFKLNTNGNIEAQDENGDIDSIEVKELILKDTSGNGRNTKVTNDNGKFTTSEISNDGNVTATDAEGSLSGSFTGSIQDAEFNGDATFNDNVTITGTMVLPMGNLTIGSTAVSTSADELNLLDNAVAGTVVNSKGVVYGSAGEVNATKLQVGGVDITSTPAELNLLDGVTGLVKADFTKLAAIDSTATELNILSGTTAGTVTNSKAVVYGSAGEVNATKLQVGGVDITASPAELNLLDDVSGLVKADFTKLAAVNATATELNILSGTTAVTADLDKLASVTSTAAELNLLDDVSGLVKADFTKLAAIEVDATKINYLTDMTGNVKSYIDTEVAGIVDSAPGTLDTLNELAAALGDDANFATTTSTALGNRLRLDVDNQTLSGAQITNALTNLGITSTNTELNLLDGVTGLVKADFTKLAAVDATAVELNYVSGVTSAIQTQLNSITGTDIDIALTGAVTGTGTITNLGDVSIATTATSDPTLTISGDASGTATFTNLGDATLTLTIADDSHNHTIANVDGLQTALDGKLAATHDFSITLTGDVTGAGTVTNMGNVSFSTTIADDSHNHVISNIDGLQTALDGKQATVSGGTGVSVSSNVVSIGQAVATNSNVTFATVSATGDIVAYASSDERLKDNIVNIENAIEKVQSLNGVTWDWNDNADELQKSIPNVGVIAQEVEQVLPQLVKDRENGYKGVDYAKLTGLLIEAIKEQQVQIDELKSKLN